MFRAAALIIVLALSGSPIAGIVCGLNCETRASAPSSETPVCHTQTASSQGAAIGGVHVCDHDVNFGPFVVNGQDSVVGAVATYAIPGTASIASNNVRAVASVFPTSPPGAGRLPNSSRTAVLRI